MGDFLLRAGAEQHDETADVGTNLVTGSFNSPMASHRPSQAALVIDEQHREAVQFSFVPQQSSGTEARDNQVEFSWNDVQVDDYDLERDLASLVDDAATNVQELVGTIQGMNQEFSERTGRFQNGGDTLHADAVDDEFTAINSAPANRFFDDSNHEMPSASSGGPAGNTASRIDAIEWQIDNLDSFDMNEPGFSEQALGELFASNQGYADYGASFDDLAVTPSNSSSMFHSISNDGYEQDSGVTFGDVDNEDDLFADHLFASYTTDNPVGTGEKRKRGDREDGEDEAAHAQRSRQV